MRSALHRIETADPLDPIAPEFRSIYKRDIFTKVRALGLDGETRKRFRVSKCVKRLPLELYMGKSTTVRTRQER